jgi:hypothetical protein
LGKNVNQLQNLQTEVSIINKQTTLSWDEQKNEQEKDHKTLETLLNVENLIEKQQEE